MKSIRNSYHLYAFITITGWALAFVLTRYALVYIQDTSVGYLRNIIASFVLLGVIGYMRLKIFDRKDIFSFLLSGASGFFLFMITFNKGAQYVTAATSSVILATVPIFTALLASVFYKERLRWFQWLAIAIQFGGMMVLTKDQGGISANQGVYWLLLAALSLSVYNILQKHLTKKYSSIQVSIFSIIIGAIPFLFYTPSLIADLPNLTPLVWFSVIAMGVFSSAIAYISWAKAFSLAENTSQVSNYMFVTPLLATIIGIVLLGEIPDRNFLIGASIIFLGLILFNKGAQILKLQSAS